MLVVMVSPWQTSRYMMAKNEHVVLRHYVRTSSVLSPLPCLYFSAAFRASVSPGLGSDTMIWAAINMMPTYIGVMFGRDYGRRYYSGSSVFLIGFSLTNNL